MSSTTLGDRPRHRGREPSGRSRRLWSVVAVLVVVGAVIAVVVQAVSDHHSSDRNPVLTLAGPPAVAPSDLVKGTLTLTDGCLSVPDGLVVWPQATTWGGDHQVVHLLTPAVDWAVGQYLEIYGTLMGSIPDEPSASLPQSVIDALQACSRSTGIRSVAFVS